jgi:ketosteroid isomerase-like protein
LLDLERVIDADDHVIALLYQRGRIKGSSSHIEQPISWDCEVRSGKIAWVYGYFSRAEALKAVGLEE